MTVQKKGSPDNASRLRLFVSFGLCNIKKTRLSGKEEEKGLQKFTKMRRIQRKVGSSSVARRGRFGKRGEGRERRREIELWFNRTRKEKRKKRRDTQGRSERTHEPTEGQKAWKPQNHPAGDKENKDEQRGNPYRSACSERKPRIKAVVQ